MRENRTSGTVRGVPGNRHSYRRGGICRSRPCYHVFPTREQSMNSGESPVVESYMLRFPFRIAPGQEIQGLTESVERCVDGLTWRLKHNPPLYILQVIGFTSEVAAQEYLKRLWAGFMWVLLSRGVAFEASFAFDKVTYVADPEAAAKNLEKNFGLPYSGPIDGLVNNNMPSVYSSQKRLRFVGVGEPTVTVSTPCDDLFSLAAEGMSIRAGSTLDSDPKFQTALDLYAAYWYERTANARLLTLMLALESLMTNPPRHQVVLELLDVWKPQVESLKNELPKDSEEWHALDALEREILFRKTDSLRRQVRSLVFDSLRSIGQKDAHELAQKAVYIYDMRSKLVHEGYLPAQVLSQVTKDGRKIVELVLRAKYCRPINAT
jgi:hypothetical protein